MTMVAAVQFRCSSLIRPSNTFPSSICFRHVPVASSLSKFTSVRRCRQSWRPLCSPQCAHKNGEDKAGDFLMLAKLCSQQMIAGSWFEFQPISSHLICFLCTESPESLFQKELNRRGINSSSLDTADGT